MKGQACRICRCTQEHACEGGCSWAEVDLCSSCERLSRHIAREIYAFSFRAAMPTDAAIQKLLKLAKQKADSVASTYRTERLPRDGGSTKYANPA